MQKKYYKRDKKIIKKMKKKTVFLSVNTTIRNSLSTKSNIIN